MPADQQTHQWEEAPCLTVPDVDKAIAYYHRFFGFALAVRGPDGAGLLGHGATLRLRQAPAGWPGARAGGRPVPDAAVPDATIRVGQPELLRRRCDDWGAHLVEPAELGAGWAGWFGLRDCYGNVLAVGPAGGAIAAVRRRVAEPLDTARRHQQIRRTARQEAREAARLREFQQRLPDQRDRYYLHFHAGLLHWVAKTASHVPEDVPLVLLGSDLPAAEQAWIRDRLPRPFHHIDLRMDDAGALELLFGASRRHFGWLGLGCLVLAGRLFPELATVPPGAALSCAWSWDSGAGFPIANPYLLFFNVDAIAAVRRRGAGVGPGGYAYQRRNRQVEGRRCYTRTPPAAARRRLRRLLPADPAGRPAIPGGLATFETTMLYQLVARGCGFGVHRVRSLTGFNHIRGGEIQDDSSDELLYIGGLGRADVLEEFSGYFHDEQIRLRYAIAEYLVLAPQAAELPAGYPERLAQVAALLAGHGLGPGAVRAAGRDYLASLGMSAAAIDAVIRPPAGRR